MIKQILPALAFILFLSSCSTFKPLGFTSNKQVASVAAPNPQTKFIDDISVTPRTADDIAHALGADSESVYHVLVHLRANDPLVQTGQEEEVSADKFFLA